LAILICPSCGAHNSDGATFCTLCLARFSEPERATPSAPVPHPVRATSVNEWAGKKCAYCMTELKANDDVLLCGACGMPHHQDCWNENGGCATFGCLAAPTRWGPNDSPADPMAGVPVPPPPPPRAGDFAAPIPAPTPTYPPPQPSTMPYQPGAMQYGGRPQPLSAPGIAIAGFVMVMVGLTILLWFVGLAGFILSWVGYAKAKREGRPTGLALAGTIVGAIMTTLGVLYIVAAIAAAGSSGSY